MSLMFTYPIMVALLFYNSCITWISRLLMTLSDVANKFICLFCKKNAENSIKILSMLTVYFFTQHNYAHLALKSHYFWKSLMNTLNNGRDVSPITLMLRLSL